MVSVVEKGGEVLRQVRLEETNASEPLMTCRNVFRRRRNRGSGLLSREQGLGGVLLTAQPASGMKAA